MSKMTTGNTTIECPPISSVWRLQNARGQICHGCGQAINKGAPIRTYQVLEAESEIVCTSGMLVLAALRKRFVFFYRHLECLQSPNVTYVSVSHVWNKHISYLQNKGGQEVDDDSEDAIEAATLVFKEAMNVYLGISKSFQRPFEAWQDYVSVPQWEQDVKVDIILSIPQLYQGSFFTVIYWHDVEPIALQQLQQSQDADSGTRLRAITHICNSAWSRRVWTAMEYIRSQRVRLLLKGYHLCEESGDLYQQAIEEAWHAEGIRIGDIVELETQAGLNRNLLPWQVGGLETIRRTQARDFGLAFERIALRGCTQPLDFYYALLGLVGFQIHLDPDPTIARRQIILQCLENQDYSPVLMPSQTTRSIYRFFYGFADIRSWGLGPLVSQAKHRLASRCSKAVFHAQRTGKVTFIERSRCVPGESDPLPFFEQPAEIVLDHVGPNVENFVISLCLRIIGVSPYAVLRRLHRNDRYSALQAALETLHMRASRWPKDITLQIIEDLGLNDPTLDLDQVMDDRKALPAFWRQHTEGVPRWAPMIEFMMNGGTIHLSEQSAIIGMSCPGCHQTVLTRAALYKDPKQVWGATGFRIPGLQYERTLPDGIGLLLKGENIVGRSLFCCPCCSGPPTEEIQVELPDIALPCPNPTKYVWN